MVSKAFKNFLFVTVVFLSLHTWAQAPMRIMHYNLLYYGNSNICNETNNNTGNKDNNLQIIMDHVQPDIFTVNEISNEEAYADRILDEVLNIDGVTAWQRGASTVSGGSSIANMLFYNSDKYELYNQQDVSSSLSGSSLLRLVDMYSLYDKQSAHDNDTVFFHVLVAHLASSSSSMRFLQCEAAMNMVINNGPGNYFFCGDFNVDSSNETSYQELINNDNSAFNFFDPVDANGTWHNNANFAQYHTQSTRSSGTGCHSGGGMDDRFDFTLISNSVLQGTSGISYVQESYTALGNDGDNFDQSLHISNNTAIPTNVAIALYTVSDHLPVVSDYMFDWVVGLDEQESLDLDIQLGVRNGRQLSILAKEPSQYLVQLHDLQGRLIEQHSFIGKRHEIALNKWSSSIYLVSIFDQKSQRLFKDKIAIQRN